MQLVKVVSGSPFKVGERSGKTPRREAPAGAGGSAAPVRLTLMCFLQQTASGRILLGGLDWIHLLPVRGSERFLPPTTGLT